MTKMPLARPARLIDAEAFERQHQPGNAGFNGVSLGIARQLARCVGANGLTHAAAIEPAAYVADSTARCSTNSPLRKSGIKQGLGILACAIVSVTRVFLAFDAHNSKTLTSSHEHSLTLSYNNLILLWRIK